MRKSDFKIISFPIKREDICILLLAAWNDNLKYRKEVKDELNKDGYSNVIIMEELPDDHNGLCYKFEQILEKHKPNLIIAFLHKDVKIDSLLIELGIIIGKYGSENAVDRLKFLHNCYDFEDTTAYIRNLLPSIKAFPHIDSNKHQKSHKIIDGWARNRCKEIQQKYHFPVFIPNLQTESK